MKSYLIIYENGNGYFCSCCRNTWINTETKEFESDTEAKDFATSYNKQNDKERDSKVENIYALSDNNPIF